MDNPNRAHLLLNLQFMKASARGRFLRWRGGISPADPSRAVLPDSNLSLPPALPSFHWPVARSTQATFAEAFALGLSEGMGLNEALGLACNVLREGTLKSAVRRMKARANAGHPLAAGLASVNFRPHPGLVAALDVGERQGNLAGELIAFARRGRPDDHRRFRRAIGRSDHACAFAAALARRMDQGPLTLAAVQAAGLVAAEGSRRFAQLMTEVAEDFRNGSPLAAALQNRRRRRLTNPQATRAPDFDVLYCHFVALADSHKTMRACLIRLAGPDFASPDLARPEVPRARPVTAGYGDPRGHTW